MTNNDYIDVRGPWPMYVNGMTVIALEGANRNISIKDARIWIATFVNR